MDVDSHLCVFHLKQWICKPKTERTGTYESNKRHILARLEFLAVFSLKTHSSFFVNAELGRLERCISTG